MIMIRVCENFPGLIGSWGVAATAQNCVYRGEGPEEGGNRLCQQSAMNNCEKPSILISYRHCG